MKKMTRMGMLALLTLALGACANQTKLAKIDAQNWTELKCSGIKSWHDCKTEAQAICPRGFYAANHLENWLIQRRVVEVACKT